MRVLSKLMDAPPSKAKLRRMARQSGKELMRKLRALAKWERLSAQSSHMIGG